MRHFFPMPSVATRDAMLRYAREGRAIFPLHGIRDDGSCSCAPRGKPCVKGNPGKHPATPNGFRDASRSPEQIFRWLQEAGDEPRNIGMPVPEGMAVVDIDPRNGGNESFNGLETAHGKVPVTRVQQTGGDGYHLWYKLDPAAPLLPSKLGPGVDIRNGGRHYVVVAPSTHANGKQYRWINAQVAIAEAPDWIKAKAFRAEDRSLADANPESPAAMPTEAHEALAALLEPHWRLGQRHNLAKALGGWLRQRGGQLADVRAVIGMLPSNDPQERIAGAAACWLSDTPNGWAELNTLVGSDVASELDRATPNHAYDKGEQWPEVWDLVQWPEPRETTRAELPPAEPGDPYYGLGPPMVPDDELGELDRIVDGLDLVAGAPCGLIGRAHAAKTPLALTLGLCVANGLPFLERATQRRRVIYLTFEKPVTANRKRVRIARSLGVASDSLELLAATRMSLCDAELRRRLGMLAAQRESLIIVDTYNSAVLGVDHNASEFSEPLQATVDELTRAGAAMLVLFHCKKGQGRPHLQDIDGHNAIGGQLDAAIAIHREDEDNDPSSLLRVTCARAIEEDFAPFDVLWANVPEPMPDDSLGSQITARQDWGLSVSVTERETETDAPRALRLTPTEQGILDARNKIMAIMSGGNVPLQPDGTVLQETLRTMLGEARPRMFEDALRQLRTDGVLVRHREGDAYAYAIRPR